MSLILISLSVLIPHILKGQALIPGEPNDLVGIVGMDGIPIVKSGANMAMLRGDRCQWNTLHGARPMEEAGTQSNRWQAFIGDKPFFIKECGACIARASNSKGCPSPSLAWSYGCRANIIYTYGECLRDTSIYFKFVVYWIPIGTLCLIICWLSCIKIRICPFNQIINYYRKKNKKTKTSSFGIA